jgi:hypothetical protein
MSTELTSHERQVLEALRRVPEDRWAEVLGLLADLEEGARLAAEFDPNNPRGRHYTARELDLLPFELRRAIREAEAYGRGLTSDVGTEFDQTAVTMTTMESSALFPPTYDTGPREEPGSVPTYDGGGTALCEIGTDTLITSGGTCSGFAPVSGAPSGSLFKSAFVTRLPVGEQTLLSQADLASSPGELPQGPVDSDGSDRVGPSKPT